MQSESLIQPEKPDVTPQVESGNEQKKSKLSGTRALILGGLLLMVLGSTVVYLAWDYMPARVQYIPRYIQSHLMPQKVHPAHVATPVAAGRPEEILASIEIESASKEERQEEPAATSSASTTEESVTEERVAKTTTEAVEESAALDTSSGTTEEKEDESTIAASSEGTGRNGSSNEAQVKQEDASDALAEAESEEEELSSPAEAESKDGSPAEAKREEEEPSSPAEARFAKHEAESEEEGGPPRSVVAEPLYELPTSEAFLKGVRHEFQGWNNCGPATLGMQLSYFGRPETQEITAPFLKPDENDKNVSPSELVAYAQDIGYGGQVVVGADLQLLQTFVSNGFPVIVESWFIPDPDDQMGHYLLLTGYEADTLTFFDSYHGPNVQEKSPEFDELWKVFNRTAVVVWPPEKEANALSILGDLSEPKTMYENALADAHSEVNANPEDKFAWFNLGSNLVGLGDIPNAVKAFDTARSLELPWRMLWYQFGPYQAYYESGQYEEVISLATTTLETSENLEESLYWRGMAYAAQGETEAARNDFEQALAYNYKFTPAQEALDKLK